MSNDPQVEHTPHSPEKATVPAKKDTERSALAIELSKVIIPVIGTILAACLSGIFLLLNNSSLLRTAAVEVTPTVLEITPTISGYIDRHAAASAHGHPASYRRKHELASYPNQAVCNRLEACVPR